MKRWSLALTILLILVGWSHLSADVYRWTDSKGTIHYGNRPPADGRNVKLLFKEITADSDAGRQELESGQANTEVILKELDEELRREAEARKQEQAESKTSLTRQELIAREKEKLEKKIAELEALPLDYFGSQKNKRVRIGYYQYRLETLTNNPDDYFKNPEPFEGNLKPPPKNQ